MVQQGNDACTVVMTLCIGMALQGEHAWLAGCLVADSGRAGVSLGRSQQWRVRGNLLAQRTGATRSIMNIGCQSQSGMSIEPGLPLCFNDTQSL